MSSGAPPLHDGGDGEYYAYERRGINRTLLLGIGAFAVLSFYLWLLVATRVDGVLFPGSSFSLGSIGGISVPGANGGNPDVATPEQRINILVMGLDQRLDEPDDQPYRTDSVVIFSIDPFTKTAGAFSIPRDTRVAIPYQGQDWTYTRINEAYEMGEFGVGGYPTRGQGAALAMEVLDYNFDISIDYYVIINWNNFISIVDDLGGITIDVPEYVYDPAYSTCTYCGEYYPVEFEPGVQDMDGLRALEYARLRKSDNDYKRIERQQLVMRAIAAKATTLNLLDIGKARGMYNTYKNSIKTNMPDTQLPGLANLGRQVGLENVRMISAAPAMFPCPASTCGGAAELLWDRDEFERLKALVFSDQRVVNEAAKIDIYNGTNTRGLAGGFGNQLALEGISVIDIRPNEWANGPIWPTTTIIDRTGNKRQTLGLIKGELGLTDANVLSAADVAVVAPDLAELLNTTADIIVVLGVDNRVKAPPAYIPSDPGYVPEPTEAPVYEEPIFEQPTEEPVITDPPVEPEPTEEPIITESPPAEEPLQ